LGNYSPRFAPADAMFINFGVKNLFSKIALKRHEKASTQLIEETSCVEWWNATIKAEELI
jgi:hypothetical protein